MNISILTHTDGKGLWTEDVRTIEITKLSIGFSNQTYYPDEPFYGELCAHFESSGFTPNSWNVAGYGLIYTDKLWLKTFKAGLRDLGFSVAAIRDIRYSEQVLHTDNYVSMAVGHKFWASWKRVNKIKTKKVSNV